MKSGTISIEVQGTRYGLRFGYAALRQLGILWDKDDLQDIFKCLGKLGELGKGKLNFEALDMMGDITLAAIIAGGGDPSITRDDIVTLFMEDNQVMMRVIKAFMDSMPQQDVSKKKKIQPKKTAQKKK